MTARGAALSLGALAGILAASALLSGPLASIEVGAAVPLGLAGLGAVVALSAFRPLVVAGVGFALLAVVKIEPAPVDVVLATLMAVTVATRSVRPRVPAGIAGLLLAIGALTFASAVNAVDSTRALTYGGITMYLVVLAVWLTWFFTDTRATRIAITAYLAVSALSAAAVVLALYGHLPGSDALMYDAYRGQGLFKDPNVYSAFLVPPTVIALEEIARPSLLPPKRWLTVPLFVLLAAGVVVAFSRAAWLNLALASTVVVTVTAFRRGGTKLAARAVGALALAGVAGLTLLAATGSLDFLQQRSRLETYDQERFGAQNVAFTRMTDHVLGFGPGQVEPNLDISTHSLFARSAFEQGAIGLLLIAALMLATLYCAASFARRDGRLHGIGSAALLGSWLGLCANSFFIDTIHWRHLYVLAALIWVGFASRVTVPDSRNRPHRPTTDPWS
ncbi:MAG: hypothetical protein U0R50_09950 [Gaiellales bacterium]